MRHLWACMRHERTPASRVASVLALIAFVACLAAPPGAEARVVKPSGGGGSGSFSHASHPFGLGVVIGEPTGLSAKYFLDSRHAIDAGLAYSFNDFLFVFADYLFHFPGALGGAPPFFAQVSPYLGIGGIFLSSTSSRRRDDKYFTSDGSSVGLGMRLPLGLEWSPSFPTLGIFVEIVPGIGLIPSTFGFIEAGIGIRYYF